MLLNWSYMGPVFSPHRNFSYKQFASFSEKYRGLCRNHSNIFIALHDPFNSGKRQVIVLLVFRLCANRHLPNVIRFLSEEFDQSRLMVKRRHLHLFRHLAHHAHLTHHAIAMVMRLYMLLDGLLHGDGRLWHWLRSHSKAANSSRHRSGCYRQTDWSCRSGDWC